MDSLRERLTQILAGYGHDYPNDITPASILAAIAGHSPEDAGLVERLRVMAPGNAIVCADRTTGQMCADIRAAADALTAQAARIEALEATLQPFASIARRWAISGAPNEFVIYSITAENGCFSAYVSRNDFWRARSVLDGVPMP